RESLGELSPGGSAVARFVQPAARSLPGAILPRSLTCGPNDCVHRLRIGGVERQRGGTGIFISVEDLLPCFAAVARAKDAAFRVGAVRMSEHGSEQAVGVARVNDERRDLLPVAQAQMLPGLAAVAGLVNAIANGKIGPLQAFAAADIDDVRVRRGDAERADGSGGLV